MSRVLVDSNVLLAVFTQHPSWVDWSSETLADNAQQAVLVVKPIIYVEVSIRFARIEDLNEALPADPFVREPLRGKRRFSPASRTSRFEGAEANADRPCPISTSVPTRQCDG